MPFSHGRSHIAALSFQDDPSVFQDMGSVSYLESLPYILLDQRDGDTMFQESLDDPEDLQGRR
jgi:hypothetical protein